MSFLHQIKEISDDFVENEFNINQSFLNSGDQYLSIKSTIKLNSHIKRTISIHGDEKMFYFSQLDNESYGYITVKRNAPLQYSPVQ